ncbi:MAG: hypothetical protein GQ574_07140 [Crocinitomix sp.]|nr:hypothetical protein [Crocinitomix sp.]
MKITLVVIICLICFSLQKNQSEPEEGQVFFTDYTQVLHFKFKISKEEVSRFWSQKGRNDEGYPNCLFDRLPEKLDPKLAEKLFDLGFVRNRIKKKQFGKLNEIFSYRSTDIITTAECTPTYRDILIFRKKKDVMGIVQICFTCAQYNIIGAKVDSRFFGQFGEFEQLNNLLYPKGNN